MRNKYLSLTMSFLLTGAWVAGLACACFPGDCQAAAAAPRVTTAPCHHDGAQTQAKDPARQDCCGKCQIERWAVLTPKAPVLSAALPGDAATDVPLIASAPGAGRAFPRNGIDRGPPQNFFTRHVLNTTFSFRGPPQG